MLFLDGRSAAAQPFGIIHGVHSLTRGLGWPRGADGAGLPRRRRVGATARALPDHPAWCCTTARSRTSGRRRWRGVHRLIELPGIGHAAREVLTPRRPAKSSWQRHTAEPGADRRASRCASARSCAAHQPGCASPLQPKARTHLPLTRRGATYPRCTPAAWDDARQHLRHCS